MPRAWLGLGANIGEPEAQVRQAIRHLDDHPQISVVAQSAMITTKPWGKTDQPDFSNMVVAIETTLEPMTLLEACLAIELAMGRVRKEVWGPRLIDIDVIAHEDIVIDTPKLTLPHRFAHERSFVLDPLREIAPEIADWVVATNTRPR